MNQQKDLFHNEDSPNIQEIINTKNNSHLLLQSFVSLKSDDEIDLDKYKEPPPKPELIKRQSTNINNNNPIYNQSIQEDLFQQLNKQTSFVQPIIMVRQESSFHKCNINKSSSSDKDNEKEKEKLKQNGNQVNKLIKQESIQDDLMQREEDHQIALRSKKLQRQQSNQETNNNNNNVQQQIIPKQKLQKKKVTLQQEQKVFEKKKEVVKKQEKKQEPKQEKWEPCVCNKTHCLKMYCSCFHNGRLCTQECRCENCQNVDENDNERFRAVQWIKEKAQRNKKLDQQKIFDTQEVWGCNCRKTRCQKRYCECYIRNKKCTVQCNCEDCENGKDEDIINEMYAQPTQQKKRRMPIEVQEIDSRNRVVIKR